jgi:hypothetical protein
LKTEAARPQVMCAHDAMVSTSEVIPNPANPNTHPREQVTLLAKIISAQGWRAPITVSNRSGLVVRGHGRLLAAQHLGCEAVPVDYQDYESAEQEYADLIADNRLAELAEADDALLVQLLEQIHESDGNSFDLTGYTEDEYDKLLAALAEPCDVTEDDFDPEPPADPIVTRGEVWVLGVHRLMCGDSTDSDDVLKLTGGGAKGQTS